MAKSIYFSHDADARRDPKIVALITKHGIEGYGRWWVVVEMLREQECYCLPCKPWAYQAIEAEIKADKDTAQKFVKALIQDFELLQSDGKSFWSESLRKRMVLMEEKSEKARQAGLKSAEMRKLKSNGR